MLVQQPPLRRVESLHSVTFDEKLIDKLRLPRQRSLAHTTGSVPASQKEEDIMRSVGRERVMPADSPGGPTPTNPTIEDERPPTLRKPSQAYVDNFIAQRGGPSSAMLTEATPTPKGKPLGAAGAAATPTSACLLSDARRMPPLSGNGASRIPSMPRIFVRLDKDCPSHYYPPQHTSTSTLRAVRRLLLALCVVQLVIALVILYATAVTHYLHDTFNELFTEAVASLSAFAACAGLVGVVASSRPMLQVLYINQLWGLSNLSTYAVLQLTSDEQGAAACRLYRSGDLSAQ